MEKESSIALLHSYLSSCVLSIFNFLIHVFIYMHNAYKHTEAVIFERGIMHALGGVPNLKWDVY